MVDELISRALERAAGRRPPESTYRLQFHAGFTFRDAAALAPYLRDLGVTHVYASPYLKARPGSTHGYDIVDHRVLNPEIGTREDYDAWVAALNACGLKQVLDIVPNHMGVATNDNPWWNDVLENGPASKYAEHFDIAWHASDRDDLRDRVLLPVLGNSYGDVLEAGELRLSFEAGAFWVAYYDRRFPVSPRSYALVLGHRLDDLEARLGAEAPDLSEYQSVLTAVGHLPDRTETDPAKVAERQREKEVVKRRLADLTARSDAVRQFIDETVALYNGTPGDPRSFDRLDELLGRQCYRLAYWRVATDEINYRRFFDVNDLAAVSTEREEVFRAAHELVLALLTDGTLEGVRIDHPDGLYDPQGYFHRLQRAYVLALARHAYEADPAGAATPWAEIEPAAVERVEARLAEIAGATGARRWPLYVVAEKILGAAEPLPGEWAVYGTSGYEFVNAVNGVFIDAAGERPLTRLYRELVEDAPRFAEVVYRCKRLVLQASLASELHTLTRQLDRIARKGRKTRDFTLNTLREALREVIACFPVYRSYISDLGAVHDADRQYVEAAVRRARARNPLTGPSVFDFVRRTLLLEYPDGATDADAAEQRRFVGKFQQVTSPVMAKGLEDTAFYRYVRFVSLSEVGGDPGRFGTSVEGLHWFNADRQAKWPYGLSPLSTHDTKRSEDVRARLNVLSEIPDEWGEAVRRWVRTNAGLKRAAGDETAPDVNDEYLIYQTLVGAWPLDGSPEVLSGFMTRVQDYVVKALHEAKARSSWVNPNGDYDRAAREFVAKLLDPAASQAFLDDFRPLLQRVVRLGLFNSLSQTLLKLASPGVPDTYQGTELWDFSLVDPDNRRPVDYDRRRELLGGCTAAAALTGDALLKWTADVLAHKEDGRVKVYVTHRALACRRDHPGLFSEGEYAPLAAAGARADHLFAFARTHAGASAVVAVPRLVAKLCGGAAEPLGDVWGDTTLAVPAGRWRNVFTGEVLTAADALPAADVFRHFPVALLVREG
ncbi:malto-oligosyltrehalose synthase [Gemmata sp.]|uniref:malto-oligosyltrehalose synthase n=1 Tax=Gemmata sp. TaxID=1914242 RepID=UPI003F7121FA